MDMHWNIHTPSPFHPHGCGRHTKPTSVSWWARITGAFCFRNVVIMKSKLTGIGGWSWKAWSWSHQPNALIGLTEVWQPDCHSNRQTNTRTPFPGGKKQAHTFFCLWVFAPAANFLEMLVSSPRPSGKILLHHSFKCDPSLRLSPIVLGTSWHFTFWFPLCLVLTVNTQQNVFLNVFISISPLNHNLFRGRSWIFIFVSLAPSTMPGLKKTQFLMIHYRKTD